jgi:hypothetical protein
MAFFLNDSPTFLRGADVYMQEMSLAIDGFAFAESSKVAEAPSERLTEFNRLWNDAIDELCRSARMFIPDGDPEPRELAQRFREAAAAYQPPSLVLASALAELERIGLGDTLSELIDPPPDPGTFNFSGTVDLIDVD